MSLYCDDSGPDFYEEFTRKARKRYKCCECGLAIEPKTTYFYCRGRWEDLYSTFRQHIDCMEACVWISEAAECITFGSLLEHFKIFIGRKDAKPFRIRMSKILRAYCRAYPAKKFTKLETEADY